MEEPANELRRKLLGIEKSVYLSDLDWTSATQSYEATNKDKNCKGQPLALRDANGHIFTCPKGIGTHANSEIRYALKPGEYDVFESLIGVHATGTENCVLYPEIRDLIFVQNTPAKLIHVEIPSDASILILETRFPVSPSNAWTNWGMAKLIKYANNDNPDLSKQINCLAQTKADAANVTECIKAGSINSDKLSDDINAKLSRIDEIYPLTENRSLESPLNLQTGCLENKTINDNGEITESNLFSVSSPVHIPFYCIASCAGGGFSQTFRCCKYTSSGEYAGEVSASASGTFALEGGCTYRFIDYNNSLPAVTFNPSSAPVIMDEGLKAAIQNMAVSAFLNLKNN